MLGPCAGTRMWLAAGVTDMRCGIDSPAAKMQMALAEDPARGTSSHSAVAEANVPQTSARASCSRSAVFTNPFR